MESLLHYSKEYETIAKSGRRKRPLFYFIRLRMHSFPGRFAVADKPPKLTCLGSMIREGGLGRGLIV
jgi:hypothetical protein